MIVGTQEQLSQSSMQHSQSPKSSNLWSKWTETYRSMYRIVKQGLHMLILSNMWAMWEIKTFFRICELAWNMLLLPQVRRFPCTYSLWDAKIPEVGYGSQECCYIGELCCICVLRCLGSGNGWPGCVGWHNSMCWCPDNWRTLKAAERYNALCLISSRLSQQLSLACMKPVLLCGTSCLILTN